MHSNRSSHLAPGEPIAPLSYMLNVCGNFQVKDQSIGRGVRFWSQALSIFSTSSRRQFGLYFFAFTMLLSASVSQAQKPHYSPGGKIERWGGQTYYEILGLTEEASLAEIKSAYHKLAMQFHPDHNAGDRAAEEKFKSITEAYSVVGKQEKRAEYDRSLAPHNPVHHPRDTRREAHSKAHSQHHHGHYHRAENVERTPEEIEREFMDKVFMLKVHTILKLSGDEKPSQEKVEELVVQIQKFYGREKSAQFKALLTHYLLEEPEGSFLVRGAVRYWLMKQPHEASKNIESLRAQLQLAYFNLEKWSHTAGVVYSREQTEITQREERYITRLLAEIEEIESLNIPQQNIFSRSLEACRAYLHLKK